MTFIVERILCTHIPFFEDVKDNIIWHIPHQYSNESAQKSEMVGLIICQSNTILVWTISRVDASDVQDTNYPYCVCRTEQSGAIMVFCDNKNCLKGVWFHVDCLNMEEENITQGVWYCSTTCEEENVKRKSQR